MSRSAAPASLTTAVRRAATRGVVTFAVVGVFVASAPYTSSGVRTAPLPSSDFPTGQDAGAARPTAADLASRHDCWTSGAAPGSEIPGHVVVTRPGSSRPEYRGAAVVGQALDQLFGGAEHDLVVHAFCR